MKKFLLIGVLVLFSFPLMAQYSYGVTGLLHTPSAEMQPDKTVMIGGGFLNNQITPPRFYFNTYNYYLNVTIFPWLEVAYTCTLFTAESLGLDKHGYSGFTNQDRYFSVRLRLLKEGQFWQHMPAIVVGTSDPFTSSGGGIIANNGETVKNGYFSRFYISMTKHIPVKEGRLGAHVSYLYNQRKDYPLNGLGIGLSFAPTCLQNLEVILECDTYDVIFGAHYLLFNHFMLQIMLQDGKYFSGGITYQFRLK